MKVNSLKKLISAFMLSLLIAHGTFIKAQDIQKNRVIILTDIENEPDDSQSLIRLVLYSNVIDIKGIIATTSVHMKNEVHPESIQGIIQAYEKVQPNLLKHEADFPDAGTLLKVVKSGLPEYGMSGVGEGKDSEDSEWIIKVLDEDDPRPLRVCSWGGPNTLAQALYKIRKTRSASDAARLVSKLRVYTISDQDDSGNWMRKNFPDLFYIVSPGGYDTSTWGAINQFFHGINNETISNSWLAKNIQQNHGPLGVLYPDVAYGMEGDSPSPLKQPEPPIRMEITSVTSGSSILKQVHTRKQSGVHSDHIRERYGEMNAMDALSRFSSQQPGRDAAYAVDNSSGTW